MGNILEFSFIYSKDAAKVKAFLDNIPRNIECISYIEIYNKLSKNDYLQSEPSDAVVSSYLMRNLQTSLSRNTVHSIFYVLGSLDIIAIEGVQNYVNSLTNRPIIYRLYYNSDSNIDSINSFFKETIEFEIDIE